MKIPFKTIGLGLLGLVIIITVFSSWEDVQPGEEGFLHYPYGDGVDTLSIYKEGTHFIAPWNKMITYNVRQQSRAYNSKVMDMNGTEIGVDVAVNYRARTGSTANLHLVHGESYAESFVDQKVKGAIKDVIGRYTYTDIYSTKREVVEDEIEDILRVDFASNFIVMDFVEIADVDLPPNIATQITVKETQKQKNLTSELMKIEQTNLADSKIETAKGDSAKIVINASAEAAAIQIKQEQLRKSSEYIEYKKVERWDGKMPQVVTSGGSGLIIDLKK